MHVFGRWEEAGVPGENPRLHGENMQTPHRKAPAGDPLKEKKVLHTLAPYTFHFTNQHFGSRVFLRITSFSTFCDQHLTTALGVLR